MRQFAPAPALAPFVSDLMVVELAEETTRLRLPEPGLVLGIRYRGAAELVVPADPTGAGPIVPAARLPDASLTGMASAARWMRTSAGGAIVLARFRPGGAAQFLPGSLHEMLGATVPLDAVLSARDVTRLRTQVAEAPDDAARVAAMDAFLTERLRPTAPDDLVAAGLKAIRDAHGVVRIRDLVRSLATSADPFEKRFRRVVGASPKQFASLVRARHAIASYRPGVSLATLAAQCGYFDESHLSRELRAVTGLPPGRLFGAIPGLGGATARPGRSPSSRRRAGASP